MKSLLCSDEQRHSTAQRLTVIAVLAVLVSLFGAGCACGVKSKSSTQSQPELIVLGESFDALKWVFNAHPSKPRMLALFSPTCGGCI